MSWTAEKSNNKKLTPLHPTGGWEFYGYKFKMSDISWTVEKIDIFVSPPQPHPTGGGVRGEHFKVTKHQVLKSISGMQLSCAIITLQIFWAKPEKALYFLDFYTASN